MRASPLRLTQSMRRTPAQLPSETARQLEALQPELRRIARQLSDNWARADDLVQDTYMALWSEAERLAACPETLRRQVFETLQARAAARHAGPSASRDVA